MNIEYIESKIKGYLINNIPGMRDFRKLNSLIIDEVTKILLDNGIKTNPLIFFIGEEKERYYLVIPIEDFKIFEVNIYYDFKEDMYFISNVGEIGVLNNDDILGREYIEEIEVYL